MKKINLKEVFKISEASVQSLSQRYRIPIEFAEWVNQNYKQNADILIAAFLTFFDEGDDAKNLSVNDRKDNFQTWYVDTNQKNSGSKIDNFLKKNPHAKLKIMDLIVNKIKKYDIDDNHISDLISNSTGNDDLSNRADLKFPDGFYWVELQSREEREKEGCEMQHCGLASARMVSLRDKNNKSHVTLERNDSVIMQISGKQNDSPNKKYWPYIAKYFEEFGLRPTKDLKQKMFGSYSDTLQFWEMMGF